MQEYLKQMYVLCIFVGMLTLPTPGVLRVRFVPEMVGPFLQVSLLPQKGACSYNTHSHTHTHTNLLECGVFMSQV